MINKWQQRWKKMIHPVLTILTSYLGKGIMKTILSTCRWEIEGLEGFKQTAANRKCILMLWHNRLVLAPFALYKFAREFNYAAIISKSRDGALLDAVVRSYKGGRSIRVAHSARHKALLDVIRHLKYSRDVVIITPDGPKGPCYKMKQGVAAAAIETGANVIPLTWEASTYWKLNTWDGLRIPKPFTTIKVVFGNPIKFPKDTSIETATAELQAILLELGSNSGNTQNH